MLSFIERIIRGKNSSWTNPFSQSVTACGFGRLPVIDVKGQVALISTLPDIVLNMTRFLQKINILRQEKKLV